MRPLTFVAAAVAALACSGTAVGQSLPQHGFLVFKDSRPGATTEVRAWGTGRLVFAGTSLKWKAKKHNSPACEDDSFVVAGPFWHRFEGYLVNVDSTPSYLRESKALDDLKDAARAWEHFDTDCKKPKENPKDKVKYRNDYDGKTRRDPTLVTELDGDGVNTVALDVARRNGVRRRDRLRRVRIRGRRDPRVRPRHGGGPDPLRLPGLLDDRRHDLVQRRRRPLGDQRRR